MKKKVTSGWEQTFIKYSCQPGSVDFSYYLRATELELERLNLRPVAVI